MKRTKILSTLALATASLVLAPVVAYAEGNVDISNPASEEISTSLKNDKNIESEEYYSQLILVDSTETRTIDITTADKSLLELSEEYGFKMENFKTSEGENLDEEYIIKNNEKFFLFKSELSASSEVIELSIPTVEEETDELYVGETEVKTEGKKGEALKTTIVTKDLSADKNLNNDATNDKDPSVNERLTVLTAPEAKIVLVGTKEKPEPVEVDEETIPASIDEVERDPISGEPLNEDYSSSSTSLTGMSGYSNTNGANVKASSKSPSEIISYDSTRGQKAVELAYTRLGVDYNWGSSRDDAVDCSGLIYWIYNQHLGVDIPRTAKQQGSSAQQISLSQLQPGDLLWTNSHIGLYIGNGQMIHASRSNDAVVVSGIGWFVDDGAKGARIR